MKSLDKPPQLVPFDIDKHLGIVNAFMTFAEQAFYKMNAMLGGSVKKSDGIRMNFNIIRSSSLLNLTESILVLTYGPSVPGAREVDARLNSQHIIAGVVADELWFTADGYYFSAKYELNERIEMLKVIMGSIKDALREYNDRIEERADNEGEDWKY